MTLYNKIRVIFIVSVIFVTAFFATFLFLQKGVHMSELQKRYVQTSLYIQKYLRENRTFIKEDENLKLFLA